MASWFNDCLLWLPMTAECHDPTNGQTLNRGTASHALNGVFGAGAAGPTKLGYRRGYYFDGGDHMQCSAGYQITTGLISIALTVRPRDVTGNDSVFAWETTNGAQVALILYVNVGDTLRFYTGGVAAWASVANASQYYRPGQLCTIVAIYDGTDQLLYMNGELRASNTTASAPSATSHPIFVGARSAVGGWFLGDIYHTGMADFAISPLMARDYHLHMLQEYNQI